MDMAGTADGAMADGAMPDGVDITDMAGEATMATHTIMEDMGMEDMGTPIITEDMVMEAIMLITEAEGAIITTILLHPILCEGDLI